jgi:RNA polymerase sigma factor (sigma-70 family)
LQHLEWSAAEDLVSETYKKLLGSIYGYDPKRGQLSTFVLQAATSVALDARRKATRRIQEEAAEDHEILVGSVSPSETVPMEVAATRLRNELAAPADPIERLVFEELFRGLGIRQIARKHDLSEKTVKRVRQNTVTAALHLLQEIFPDL